MIDKNTFSRYIESMKILKKFADKQEELEMVLHVLNDFFDYDIIINEFGFPRETDTDWNAPIIPDDAYCRDFLNEFIELVVDGKVDIDTAYNLFLKKDEDSISKILVEEDKKTRKEKW